MGESECVRYFWRSGFKRFDVQPNYMDLSPPDQATLQRVGLAYVTGRAPHLAPHQTYTQDKYLDRGDS